MQVGDRITFAARIHPSMNDIFDKIRKDAGPIGRHAKQAHGYFAFPKLEGELGAHMTFRGKEVLVWSLNNYLGLANHPEVRKVDADAARDWGLAYPMGARMMSGQTKYHEQLEDQLSDFMQKEDTYLLNFGYQGCMSTIDALLSRHDVLVFDSESHACMMDGARLHAGKRFMFQHNDMDSLDKQLEHARKVVERTGGGILVMTEGVFGMAGDQGRSRNARRNTTSAFSWTMRTASARWASTVAVQGTTKACRTRSTYTSERSPRAWPVSAHSSAVLRM